MERKDQLRQDVERYLAIEEYFKHHPRALVKEKNRSYFSRVDDALKSARRELHRINKGELFQRNLRK